MNNRRIPFCGPMRTQASIYSRCNPELIKLFEQAGHPSKLMCVALDYAKAQHTALICNGLGDLLKGAFAIDNNPNGVAELLRQVRDTCQPRQIRPAHVFFGGEDCPAFAQNFVRALRAEKFLVVRVNAWEAKQQRDNFQASSDALDLLGIARCCLNRRGETVRDLPAAYANLKIATRDRDKLVRGAHRDLQPDPHLRRAALSRLARSCNKAAWLHSVRPVWR